MAMGVHALTQTNVVKELMFVVSMRAVKTIQGLTGVLAKLVIPEMERIAPVSWKTNFFLRYVTTATQSIQICLRKRVSKQF